MTNQQGAPEAPPPAFVHYPPKKPELARVDFLPIATKAERSNGWVTVALVEAQQPAPSAAVAAEVENLRKALQFYADKDHFNIADEGAWDTVSGEPQNYWCDEEGTATVEDGTIARLALAGHQIKFDADAAPQPSPTPQADSFGSPELQAMILAKCVEKDRADSQPAPIDMVLHCPACGLQHIDAPDAWRPGSDPLWDNPPHRSHLCHGCGHIWRPADVPTNGMEAVKTRGKADSPIAARAPADSVTAPAGGAVAGPNWEALRHSANEWADMATNGLQWLRNIVDGVSDAKTALANMEGNLAHCRAVNDAPEVQAAIRAASTPPAQAADSAQEDAAWMPLTPELLTAIESGDHGKRFWIAGPSMTEAWAGEYEWRQGRVPHGFNTQAGRVYSSEVTHILPYKPPALPTARKQGGAT